MIAIGILAHTQVELLNILLNQLDDLEIDIYLHLDQKSNILIKKIIKNKNLIILDKRVSVKWGDFTQIQAELNIFQEIANSKKKYKKILLISGQDLLIKKINVLKQQVYSNSYECIENYEIENSNLDIKSDRVLIKYPKYLIGRNKVQVFFNRVYRKIYPYFFKRKKYNGKIFFGSNWINISLDAMNYILKEMKKKEVRKLFEDGFLVDETFVQTILSNSIYKNNIKVENYRYIDWKTGPEYPKILLKNDFEKIINSNKWFARKFDIEKDKEVIEQIINYTSEEKSEK